MQLSPGDKSSSVPAEQTDRSRDNAPSVREPDPIVVLQRNNREGLIGGCLCRTSGHGVRTEVAAVTSRSHSDLGMCRPEGLRSFPWDKSAVMERSWLGNAWNCLEITPAPRNGDPKGLCRAGWGPWGHGECWPLWGQFLVGFDDLPGLFRPSRLGGMGVSKTDVPGTVWVPGLSLCLSPLGFLAFLW